MDASSIPVETPPTRGRDTMSQKKKSEAELEKALEEVELATPKTKKIKTSKKKSPSKTKFVEPFTEAKRTRSAVKSKKVKVVEEKESEKEEETNDEQDKKETFGKRTILKSRILIDLEDEGMVMLL
ncbi:uncharacterized protein [Nicotiana sylvestris]|uniref:uncharacterized protein n=1 Tax=Nicotiana sylvestris TaxID=4096 RepID=UPI00388CD8E9